MEIHQLRAFLAVARTGHLTRAAEQLHLTQPAVSKQLKALEEEWRVALFERLPGGMQLTAAGHQLLPQAEKALAAAMELANDARALQGEVAGSVQLGTIVDPESIRLGSFLATLLQDHPLVQVRLQHGISGEVLERIASGQLDAGFALGPVERPGLAVLQLDMVRYRVIAPPQWAGRLQGADWAALAAMPWVGTPAHSSQYRLLREMFAAHGLLPRIAVEADQEASMLSLVASGVGLCLMREPLAAAAAARGEAFICAPAPQPCPLSFVHARSRAKEPVIEAMRAVLRTVWNL